MASTTLLFIGTPEIVMIMLVILLLFGSKRIPEVARGLGRGMRQFRDATQEIQRDIQSGVRDIEKDADLTENLDDKK